MANWWEEELLRQRRAQVAPLSIPAQLTEEGDASRRANAGIFGDLFDILSRTSRASATAAKYALDNDSSTGALQGIKEGLTGRSQTNYSDVLAEHGVEGPQGAVLGFLGDVLLDPLTYVGIKSTKGTSRAKALAEAVTTHSDFGEKAVMAEAARLRELNPTQGYLTFAGKKVSPALKIKPVDNPVGDLLLGAEGSRRAAVKAFSGRAEKGYGLQELSRQYEAGTAGSFSHYREGIKDLFSNLSAEERMDLSMAIEEGKSLKNVRLSLKNGEKGSWGRTVQHPPGFESLEDYAQLARKSMKDFFDVEVGMGLLTKDKFRENYVPHYFAEPPVEMTTPRDTAVKAGGADKGSYMKKRSSNVPLREAMDKGYKPVMDIAELIEHRANEHYRTVGRSAYLDDAVKQFGAVKTGKNAAVLKKLGYVSAESTLKDSPIASKFKDMYIPEPVGRALQMTDKVLRDPTTGAEIMSKFDKVIGEWKYLNTGVNPGFHIRNSYSDFLMNSADGVQVKQYGKARRILAEHDKFAEEGILRRYTDSPVPWGGNKVRVGGKEFSAREIYEAYVGSGAKAGYITSELQKRSNDIERNAAARAYIKVKDKATRVGDTREDFFRLAHFIDQLEKGGPIDDLSKAATKAAENVRKWNIDYGDLSSFEKNYVKKALPFYTFMRKNLPLQMELLFTKPGFMALYPKGQDLMQGLLGTTNAEGEYLVPDWIRESAPVRIISGKQAARNPLQKFLAGQLGMGEGDSAFLRMQALAPIGELETFGAPVKQALQGDPFGGASEFVKSQLSGLTPAAKVPIELGTQRSLFSGQEIGGSTGDWTKWLASSIGGAPTRAGMNVSKDGGPASTVMSNLMGLPVAVASANRREAELYDRKGEAYKEIDKLKMSDPVVVEMINRINKSDLPEEAKPALIQNFLSNYENEGVRKMKQGIKDLEGTVGMR